VDTATAPRPLLSRCDLRWGAPKEVWGGPTIRA
jgi:hypothetical protein